MSRNPQGAPAANLSGFKAAGPAVHPHTDHYLHTTPHEDCSQCQEGSNPCPWAILHKGPDSIKGGPDFWVVDPTTLSTFTNLKSVMAYAPIENDARRIAQLLNSDDDGPASPVVGSMTYLNHPISRLVKETAGEILTLIEAVLPQDQQFATKKLVKKMFRRLLSDVFNFLLHYDSTQGADGPEPPDPLAD